MSNPGLAHLDALIHAACMTAGIATTGAHRSKDAPDGPGTTCRLYVDDAMQKMGDLGQVTGSRTVLAIFKADVPALFRGDTITCGPKVYKLEDPMESTDESLSLWVVAPRG